MAELTSEGARIETLDGRAGRARDPRTSTGRPLQAEKGGYKHFMLKEIFEQPRAVEDTLRGRVDLEDGDVVEGEIGLDAESAKKHPARRTVRVRNELSRVRSLGRYWIEQLARMPAHAELASEVRYREPGPQPRRSGRRGEPVRARPRTPWPPYARLAKAGARVLAIANVLDSAIPRAADGRALHARGARDRRGVDQVLHDAARRACSRSRSTSAAAAARSMRIGRATLLQALLELPNEMRACSGQEGST